MLIIVAQMQQLFYNQVSRQSVRIPPVSCPDVSGIAVRMFRYTHITAKRITNTFFEVKRLADFSSVFDEETIEPEKDEAPAIQLQNNNSQIQPVSKLGLSYNINLILPETDDPKVFNAIFKSLKENLLL